MFNEHKTGICCIVVVGKTSWKERWISHNPKRAVLSRVQSGSIMITQRRDNPKIKNIPGGSTDITPDKNGNSANVSRSGSGNRTRVSPVAGAYSTTRPTVSEAVNPPYVRCAQVKKADTYILS